MVHPRRPQGELSRENPDHAYQSIVASQVLTGEFRQAVRTGVVEAQLFFFERVTVFLFPASRYEGIFRPFDRSDPFPVQQVIKLASEATLVTGDGD